MQDFGLMLVDLLSMVLLVLHIFSTRVGLREPLSFISH